MKTGMLVLTVLGLLLSGSGSVQAQDFDTSAAWPLCGRITENKPKRWKPSKGCPSERFGNPAYSDAPFSSTFGPRPLNSENNRYDFHRGVDIATPIGTPIFAISDGNVEIAGVNSGYSDPLIKVRHYRPGATTCTNGGGCYHSYYLHVSDWVVSEDQQVQKGQLIGYTGASGASGFEHLHFELRDAPDFDVFSAWSRDAVHPFRALAYDVPNNSSVTIHSVDATDPLAIDVALAVESNRYDLVSVEMAVFDANQQEVPQPGNTPDANGYHVLPAFFDMESWNFEYSHKDSAGIPWSDFGAGGPFECPYHGEHGGAYNANVHMDAQDPADFHVGLFNGVRVTTGKYWLTGNRDYVVDLEFLALQGPAACIEATAVFASGDLATTQWGNCGGVNQPPTPDFAYSCDGLQCAFDANASSDPDGTVSEFAWDFGDGSGGSGLIINHGFSAAGDYLVNLQVTDDDGATASVARWVSAGEPASEPLVLTISTNRKGNQVMLRWTGGGSAEVDIWRNSALVETTANDGAWNDRKLPAGQTYLYRICDAGNAENCSNVAAIGL